MLCTCKASRFLTSGETILQIQSKVVRSQRNITRRKYSLWNKDLPNLCEVAEFDMNNLFGEMDDVMRTGLVFLEVLMMWFLQYVTVRIYDKMPTFVSHVIEGWFVRKKRWKKRTNFAPLNLKDLLNPVLELPEEFILQDAVLLLLFFKLASIKNTRCRTAVLFSKDCKN